MEAKNKLIDSIEHPEDYLKEKVVKEQNDVTQTKASIEATLASLLEKEEKLTTASTSELKKKYKEQVKLTKNYISDLHQTLALEMYEAAVAERNLRKHEK